ncbi:unnamed protein product [Arabidopsis thaliana]|uniref:Uncharacterized protein n=1 Tax=Arabidopsis thaliana TaxID=3702 RepID=A0A5S9XZ01_ARATH|nr:unnamed protein product [Arabidopsis thaliana]
MAIKISTLFLLFLLVESCTARYIPADLHEANEEGRQVLKVPDESKRRYLSLFKWKVEDLQREADEKYPLWKSTNHLDRSLFLLEKAQDYVQLWDTWRKGTSFAGNPYGDLRNNVQGDLWPKHYDYCRQSEGTNLLTYLMYDFCRQSEGANLLKYMTYGLSPEADLAFRLGFEI